jgi:polysaccharide export outer membrane protein
MKIFRSIRGSLFFLVILVGSACKGPTELDKIIYMNGLEPGKTYLNGPFPEEYRIRPNDQLYIQVISDDPANAAFLNLTGVQSSSNTASSQEGLELITYLVDNDGNINYPQLGEIHVGDLKTGEVRDIIQKEVDKYLETASVFVKLVNRNITVIGEVKSPGQKSMVKNQLTIFEALGTAGDITDWGNRKNIKVIRELPEGKHIAEIDLTAPNVITSPYYYILPNDIIYVEHRDKIYGDKNVPYGTRLSLGLSVISITLLILNIFLI